MLEALQAKWEFFVYLLVQIYLLISLHFRGWLSTWKSVKIPSIYPYFADMRVIQNDLPISNSVSAHSLGQRSAINLDYPRIWLGIGRIARLDLETHFTLFVGVYVGSFVVICALLLWRFPSFFLLAVSLSSSVLLGVERGKNDLLMFDLISTCMFTSFLILVPLFFASSLKIYPILALAIWTTNFWRFSKKVVLFGFTLSLISLFSWVGQLHKISQSNTATSDRSLTYGPKIFAAALKTLSQSQLRIIFLILTLLLLSAFAIIDKYFLKLDFKNLRINRIEVRLFLSGSIVFVTTFIFSQNWDYRLIFLIFCIPYIWNNLPRRISFILLICLLGALNSIYLQIYLPYGHAGLAIELGSKFLSFTLILYILVRVLESNSRDYLASGAPAAH
jgi:hypothetical protein